MATTLGSRKTMPFSFANTSVFAVPRSIPMSFESSPNTFIKRFETRFFQSGSRVCFSMKGFECQIITTLRQNSFV